MQTFMVARHQHQNAERLTKIDLKLEFLTLMISRIGLCRYLKQTMFWSLIPSIFLLSTHAIPSWLSSRLDTFDLRVHDFETTGRGILTLRDRAPGDVVIAVPECDAFTASSLIERFPDVLERAVEQSTEMKLSDEQVLAMGLLLLRTEGDRYVSSLPERQYSVLEMPDAMRNLLPMAYMKIILAYQDHVQRLHASLNDVLESKVSLEDFHWAFATIRSRCVGMDDEDDDRILTSGTGEKRVILPAFDLLNHKFGSQAVKEYSHEDQEYVLKTNDAYTKGDQVFISYDEKRDNLKMLMTYGFCIPGNPEAVAFFDVDDLLGACSLARPAYFTETVLQQLHGLIKKLGKERDLYELDGDSHQPRESLQDGINMMLEIEKQFLSEPDMTFAEDVFNALVYLRKEEIGERLSLIDQIQTDEAGWMPMLGSIRALLRAEQEYLSIPDEPKQDRSAEL